MKKMVNISVKQGTSKKTGRPYKYLNLEIGKYSKAIFEDPIIMDYVEDYVSNNPDDLDDAEDEL